MDPAKLKIFELRDELSARGLDVKGNKAILVERLKKVLEEETGKEIVDTSIVDTSTGDTSIFNENHSNIKSEPDNEQCPEPEAERKPTVPESCRYQQTDMSGGDHDEEGCVIKMRGLPWSTTVEEIMKFFSGCNIKDGKLGIQMTMSREGRPSGEAYVEMESEEDMELACKKDREHMGHRYIEVFRAKRSEMDWVVKRSGLNVEHAMDDGCVRLRGLPFGCSKEEIANFFAGLEIVPNGIILPTDYNGRSTGEAYVQFINKDVAEKALQKHKEKIGHRYIEIFRSSLAEIRSTGPKMRPMVPGGFNQRPAPYDRGDRFGGMNRYGGNMGPISRPSRNFKAHELWKSRPGKPGIMSEFYVNNLLATLSSIKIFHQNTQHLSSRIEPLQIILDELSPQIVILTEHDMKDSEINRLNVPGYGDFDDGWEDGPWSNGSGGPRGMQGRGMKSSMYGGGMNNSGGWNGGGQHSIHMRGLPFRATQSDIADFFRPVNPVNIRIVYDDNGRPSGEADVEFDNHDDALRGMSKDKSHMQHRYIELFLNSTPGNSGGGYGNGGGFNSGLNNKFRGGGYSNNMGNSNNMGFNKYNAF